MSKFARLAVPAVAIAAIGFGVLALAPQAADAQATKVGASAPEFSLPGSDGKTHTLASLQEKNGFTYLYFIKNGCPVNNKAIEYYNRLYTSYKGKVAFVGVFNGDKSAFESFKAEFKPPYTVIFDPSQELVKKYEVQRSPAVIKIEKGQVAQRWKTYSVAELGELQASFGKASGVKIDPLDFSGAPTSPRAG